MKYEQENSLIKNENLKLKSELESSNNLNAELTTTKENNEIQILELNLEAWPLLSSYPHYPEFMEWMRQVFQQPQVFIDQVFFLSILLFIPLFLFLFLFFIY